MSDKRKKAADKLLQAAHEFWKTEREAGAQGAVKWLKADDGSMVIFTRGEYRDQLMRNITAVPGQGEYFFDKEQGDGGGV